MNKKITILLLLAILSILTITISYSYQIIKFKADNIITFGSIKMRLVQKEVVNSREVLIDNKNKINITGKEEVKRFVYVENLGIESIFVRVSLDVFVTKNSNKILKDNLINFDFDTENWVYKDGWYYYKGLLKGGEKTTHLFDKMLFNIQNSELKGTIDLDIVVQAVQASNNSDNAIDAEGWPSK